MSGTVYLVRVNSETLPSLARSIQLLGRLHDMFDVDCQQQVDDLQEILEGAQEQAKAYPDQHSVHYARVRFES